MDATVLGIAGVPAELGKERLHGSVRHEIENSNPGPVMRQALDAASISYTLDWFTDAIHGFAPAGTERYNRAASELHWERVHSLFRRHLG